MASTTVTAFPAVLLVLLALHPGIARSNSLSPMLSPVLDDVCKEIECGKGTCKPSSNSTFLFECQCDVGWKQTHSDDDDHLKFLPCVIPNCTLHHSCEKAPSPAQEKERRANESIFDPCHWVDCGGGFCNKTSAFTYSCECSADYNNLLNVTAFPCFKECTIGLDCKNLGISASNKSSQTPAVADDSRNQATSIRQGNLWLTILMTLVAMVR